MLPLMPSPLSFSTPLQLSPTLAGDQPPGPETTTLVSESTWTGFDHGSIRQRSVFLDLDSFFFLFFFDK